jgi:hypothetical protein
MNAAVRKIPLYVAGVAYSVSLDVICYIRTEARQSARAVLGGTAVKPLVSYKRK